MKEFHWKDAVPLIESLIVKAGEGNVPVEVGSVPTELQCIGIGTDAAVFVHSASSRYAFKVYAEGLEKKRINEERAYQKLSGSSYYPIFYGSGERFIVISFESGIHLYDCLITGTYISPEVIEQVDKAVEEARLAGLNPRDIHLKNIILQGRTIKLIDVSEYVKPGNDERWEHLKEGYRLYYPLIASKKVSPKFLDFVKEQYEKQKLAGFSAKRFGRLLLPFVKKKEPES
ncbi:serine/threonine protein kinase [Bacillus aerolatus]|uniref:Serine/threonine protein kinase n=1 Tax=Bacillus aerolatus TaxID=2653354 RepID=A0A6I1FG98_9BACI|nr:serine/threonine protein kinase [Bacillus aerolatus]KAB7704731.1 serine/threonine protein kinase [Bacillus aerolatus]